MFRAAGITFEAHDCGETFLSRAEKYAVMGESPEFTITVSDEETAVCVRETGASEDGARYLVSGMKFYFELIGRGGMMLHASAVCRDGRAFLFSGPCGVGKSTHASYWLDLFEDAYILNDDKPAIRLAEDGFRAYGTPWSGKRDVNRNASAPIAGIAFIERADKNYIERIPAGEAAASLLAQTVRRISAERMGMLLTTLDRLIAEVPVYRLGCTLDRSSAALAYSVMNKNER